MSAMLAVVAFVTLAAAPEAEAAGVTYCTVSAGLLTGESQGVLVDGVCVPLGGGAIGADAVEYRTVGCNRTGHMVVGGVATAGEMCPTPVPRCQLLADGGMSGVPFWADLVQYRTPGGPWLDGSYWCPQTAADVVGLDAATLRDQAVRLLPAVAIGTTDDHVSLVNIQTIFWADTAAARDLGQVTVSGLRVWLRVEMASASWDFGDGETDTATAPGKAYDAARDPCAVKTCPDYYGHTYTTAGPMTAELQVSWNASWSVDGEHFAPVGNAPITGPRANYSLTVREARGVLVSDDS